MIIRCRCGQQNRIPETPNAYYTYKCGKCGNSLDAPTGEADAYLHSNQLKPVRRLDVVRVAILLAVLGFVFYNAWHDSVQQPVRNTEETGRGTTTVQSPAEARESQIVKLDVGKPGDSELMRDYQEVNIGYFGDKLPRIPVIWEPRLQEVGPLFARGYTLEGLAFSDPELILLNPINRGKRAEVRRVLCHEMVHVYLFTIGDTRTVHGPAFQAELHNLLLAGAFQGIWATEDQKSSLRSWLKNESRRLHIESVELKRRNSELDKDAEEIDRQKALVEQAHLELNQRIVLANEQGDGWPTDEEIDSFKEKGRMFSQRVANFNEEVAAFNKSVGSHSAGLKRYNYEARRYNLMMAYPDGLDEDSIIRPKGEEVRPHGTAGTQPDATN